MEVRGRVSGSLIGVNIKVRILTPIKEPENRPKWLQKSTKPDLLDTLLEGVLKVIFEPPHDCFCHSCV
jgi:hypothetical protein